MIPSFPMRWMRPQLGRIAGGWLVFHLCLLISVPTALCSTVSPSAVAAQCTCDHTDGPMCPMHHGRSESKARNAHSCSCRSTSDPVATIAESLIGPAAVLVQSPFAIASADAADWLQAFNREPLESSTVPDSPPPRA